MKIGELAKTTAIPVETIRYYEKIGLLPEPDRDASGYRSYRNAHLERLLFIKRCRNLDMAQDEIRELIEDLVAISQLSEEEEADEEYETAVGFDHVRGQRDHLLSVSDWTTNSSDSPLSDEKKAEWVTYRQALRDYPDQAARVSDLPDWPTAPDAYIPTGEE